MRNGKEGDLILQEIDDAENLKERTTAHVEKGLPDYFAATIGPIKTGAVSAQYVLDRLREPSWGILEDRPRVKPRDKK